MTMKVLALGLVLCLSGCLAGCVDIAKVMEVQMQQQNALITSITDKIEWENVAAILKSTLNDPSVDIGVYYVQGAKIQINTRGVTSSIDLTSQGGGTAPNDSETAAAIREILASPLPPTQKEQLVAKILESLIEQASE